MITASSTPEARRTLCGSSGGMSWRCRLVWTFGGFITESRKMIEVHCSTQDALWGTRGQVPVYFSFKIGKGRLVRGEGVWYQEDSAVGVGRMARVELLFTGLPNGDEEEGYVEFYVDERGDIQGLSGGVYTNNSSEWMLEVDRRYDCKQPNMFRA